MKYVLFALFSFLGMSLVTFYLTDCSVLEAVFIGLFTSLVTVWGFYRSDKRKKQ